MNDFIRRTAVRNLAAVVVVVTAATSVFGAPAADSIEAASAGSKAGPGRPRLELGIRTDLSNEYYFEDTFDDTTFRDPLPRSTPEVVQAGVASVEWSPGANGRFHDSRVLLEGGAGSRLRWGTFDSRWTGASSSPWRLSLAPRIQWRHDRTFDRDREEFRSHLSLQARHRPAGSDRALALRVWGDLLRSSGAGSEFVLDRDVAGAAGSFERMFGLGSDLQLDYALEARAFPDSTVRNHLEQRLEIGVRHDRESGALAAVRLATVRRDARGVTPDSRDRFWNVAAHGELRAPALGPVSPALRLEFENLSYDTPDSLLFFDYARWRASLAARFEPAPGWTLELGPGGELLRTEEVPDERYAEAWGALDVQWLGTSGLWSLAPSLGWREYDSPGSGALPALHSSYAFLDVTLVLDHALPGRLRTRGFGYARLERHADRAQDSRSLYFSLDVRRLF